MDDRYVFVNNAINDSIILYEQYKDEEESINKECFLACVMEMLSLIYDEETIMDAYYNKDEDSFKRLITEYGYDKYDEFIDSLEKYYEMDYAQKDSQIKKKNKYFNIVQKELIDMVNLKNNEKPILIEDRKKIYNLLFTANSKSFIKKTYALLTAYNPYEIDEYFKKQGLLLGD